MPKILITGNGFDLNQGLPTSYSDIIRILKYIEKNNIYNFNKIFSESKNFENIKNNFNEFPFQIDKIQTLKNELKKNLWFEYLKNEFNIENWIDFEFKIENVLKQVISSISSLNPESFIKNKNGKSSTFKFDILESDIRKIEILKSFKYITRIDNFHKTFNLNSEYLIKKHNRFIGLNHDLIVQNLLTELFSFKQILHSYFSIFVCPLIKQTTLSTNTMLFDKVDKHYTFNYTNTFDTYYNKNQFTNFLHGSIEKNNIVLGINNTPKSENLKKNLIPFTKKFQKLNIETDFRFIYEYANKKFNNYCFFFWGHSLDSADKKYIDEVFDFILDIDIKCKKIIIIYHSDNNREKLLLNIMSIRDEDEIEELIKKNFLELIHINSNKLKEYLKKECNDQERAPTATMF